MAPSSLQPNDGAPHATAERFEQIPRRPRTGRDIDRRCAECHAPDGKRNLTVISVAEVGTDINRSHMWTELARDTYNNFREGRDWGFKSFRKISGYVAEPLAGLWLNGPYLHNGSVPTLRDLLEPPDRRPKVFYRGNDLYDPQKVGFVSDIATAGRQVFTRYDTSVPGNSNSGHLYGTQLSDDEKRAVVEYMKAF